MGSPLFNLSAPLDALAGRRLPGGCDDCTAYQTVRRIDAGLFLLVIHHDATCPQLTQENR